MGQICTAIDNPHLFGNTRSVIKRDLEELLHGWRSSFPVITITGPRQSGKTTLCRSVFADLPYVSFEDPDKQELFHEDPRGFLAGYMNGAVFDEVQNVPELARYLQRIVDERPAATTFVLTGSQQFGVMPRISQSLAGRTAVSHLLPFTLGELYRDVRAGVDLNTVLFHGLYPPVHDRSIAPRDFYSSYVQTYIERDVRDLLNVRDLSTFRRFVRLCAARSGRLLNRTELADDTGVSPNTVASWLAVLEASYIVFVLQPYYRNFNKRLIKTPKLYFFDTGLAAWLLGIRSTDDLDISPYRGSLFETFVVAECMKFFRHRGDEPPLYFWRDRKGTEVDLLYERAGIIRPVEVKSGATLTSASFSGIDRFLRVADGTADPQLVYGGEESGVRNGVRYRSWRELGEGIFE